MLDGIGLFSFLRRSLDECKLDIGIKIGAHVLERQLELLDSSCLLDGQGDDILTSLFVLELFHTLDHRVVEEAQQKNLHLSMSWNFTNTVATDQLLHWHLLIQFVSQLNINERYNLRLEPVLRRLGHDNELLTHLWPNLDSDLLLKLLAPRIFNEPTVELLLRVLDS